MLALLILLGLGGVVAWRYWPWREVKYGAGLEVAPAEPVQLKVAATSLGRVAGYELTELAEYRLTARVLSSRRYRYEEAHELSPVDLALGWGRMSDEAALDRMEISQSFRFFFYQWRGEPPLPPEVIKTHAANVHIIPASRAVERVIFGLPRGAVVRLEGELVKAEDPAGHIWISSLTRDDVGPGACELMFVESAERIFPLAGKDSTLLVQER